MNFRRKMNTVKSSLLATSAMCLLTAPAYALDLVAVESTWSPDGGATKVSMWGFALDTGQVCDPATLPVWAPGPEITETDLVNEVLTINLRNCLSAPVSLMIPGQQKSLAPVTTTDANGRTRIISFDAVADPYNADITPDGGTQTYIWNNISPGTYLYQSGTHPALQMHMGLYGVVKVNPYPNENYTQLTLLYSEIDPELHVDQDLAAPGTQPLAATPLNYKPSYFLVNGEEKVIVPAAGDTATTTVISFVNAGLDFHVPALSSGYLDLVAEDGNEYPFPKKQYSVSLAAGKTIEAFWQPVANGNYVIYDRRGNGMIATLEVGAGASNAPVANPDSYTAVEDGNLIATAGEQPAGVLDNDLPVLTALTANLISPPSNGTLADPGLAPDGSFTYIPNADFNGLDSFTYRASDDVLNSNITAVTITVDPQNDLPVADPNGPYIVAAGQSLTLDGTGSYDIDGDPITYAWDFDDNATGDSATPSHTYEGVGIYTVSLVVHDGTVDSVAATTSVEVVESINSPPVAVVDSDTVTRNSQDNFINLTGNDTDADDNLKDLDGNVLAAQITIATGTVTSRGGTVSTTDNGAIYTPKRNFRGTDSFAYTVKDQIGAESNQVTVLINVVK